MEATTTHGEAQKAWMAKYKDDPRAQACAAVADGDMELLDAVLAVNGKPATAAIESPTEGHTTSALIQAASGGDSAAVERLLNADADPNDRAGTHAYTPIGWAATTHSLSSVRLLMAHGGRPDTHEDLVYIVLTSGQQTNYTHIDQLLRFLLEHFEPTTEALASAIERSHVEWVEQLLEAGADPNEISIRTCGRPLLAALKSPGSEASTSTGQRLLRALVKHGAKLDEPVGVREKNNPTPLEAAVEVGAYWAVPVLLELGADIDHAVACIGRRTDRLRTTTGSETARAAMTLLKAYADRSGATRDRKTGVE